MSDLFLCPYCKNKLEDFPSEDLYCCFGFKNHAFSHYPRDKKFGLVIITDCKDNLIAGTETLSINKINYPIPNNYNINNCCEILMSYYKRFTDNRAFT